MGNTGIAIFKDGSTPYTSSKYIDDVTEFLEQASMSLFKWFELNFQKVMPIKCHLLTSTDQEVSLNVDNFAIKNSKCEEILSVKFHSKLTFNLHISHLCKKSSRKVNALVRITPYMDLPKRRLLENSFFKAQFNYCWESKPASQKVLANCIP